MVMENLRIASIGVEESAGGYESCKKKSDCTSLQQSLVARMGVEPMSASRRI